MVYFYISPNAVLAAFDGCHPDFQSAVEYREPEIDARGWIKIDDPLPYCRHDALLPIRVKGQNTGSPQYGKYEIYENGIWKDYDESQYR